MDTLTQLYREIARPLIGYAMSFTGEINSAEDIVSETFVRAAEHCIVKKELPVRAWFYKVARNIALDMLKKKGRLEHGEVPEVIDNSVEANPEASLVNEENNSELMDKIGNLPELYRSALILREINGLAYAEIAGIMGVSQDNVKALLHRAKSKLRESYGREKGYGR